MSSQDERDRALERFGWSPFFAEAFAPHSRHGLRPGRISVEHRGELRALTEEGDLPVVVSGRLQHRAASQAALPAVGDWVALQRVASDRKAQIQAVLPRRTKFSRRAAGKEDEEQVVAANIDFAFITAALGGELNHRRIERYLTLACESGARPVVLLTKADLCDEPGRAVDELRERLGDAPVHLVSGLTGEGLEALHDYLGASGSGALLGSSGVGKSTLINLLCGEARLDTRGVRQWDQKGRHTTTRRQLVVLPRGGLMIDTPGMREIQLWDSEWGVAEAFPDIDSMAAGCRFGNCQHGNEPGCAVRPALEEGRLSVERFKSYSKLRDEARRREERARYGRTRTRGARAPRARRILRH